MINGKTYIYYNRNLKNQKMKHVNNIIRIVLIIILLVLPGEVFSQKDYEKGYIITNNKDTLIGLVKDRKQPPFGKLYKKVYFKKKHRKKKYGPDQILGYKQGNREFESLWINVSSHLYNEKYTSIQDSGEKEFLKVVVKGYLTYYQREFADPESDYIDQISLFKREDENYLVRVTQGIFGLKKKNLAVYFNDCSELVKRIEDVELKDPVAIVNFYNSWKVNNP